MFSVPIFKQSIRANYTLWLIFTVILSLLISLTSAVYDPAVTEAMMKSLEGTSLGALAGDRLSMLSSFLGTLSETFYNMLGVVLPMVYIIIMANGLVASEVDRGSMAYTLSTPTKRVSVVVTKAVFLVSSVFAMFVVLTIAGLLTIQSAHGVVWGVRYTPDVQAAAPILGVSEVELAGNLGLILADDDALTAGAAARKLDKDIYVAYLELARQRDAAQAAAQVLGVEASAIETNPSLIASTPEALAAAARVMGMELDAYRPYLSQLQTRMSLIATMGSDLQTKMTTGLVVAAELLDMDIAELASNMGALKTNQVAFDAAVVAAGVDSTIFSAMIDFQLATQALSKDVRIDFSTLGFIMINVSDFLLMFAVSGISFFASCYFNLTKHSLALGAGLPLGFFVLKIMSQIGGTALKPLQYLTINTFFDAAGIANGDYNPLPLLALTTIGVALYAISIQVFKTKDLPL
jgi:ABC-2 type transport system permease protein